MQARARFMPLFLSAVVAIPVHAAEIDYVEDFSLATNRDEAVAQLIPGTEDHYYYQCLNFQNQGRYDKARETLAAWVNRYGHTSRVEEIRNRQALLDYEKDPKGALSFLQTQLGLTFSHQREIMGQKPANPTRLDQKLISRDTLRARAFANRNDLSWFEDSALEFLIAENLSGNHRRDLLRRLRRPDYPNLPHLVKDDLEFQYSQGFGAFAIHRQMLLPQMEELLKLRPQLLNEVNFVNAYISKLQPGPDVDWQRDAKAREAYLDSLWKFVRQLSPAHNSLKANVLFQRLTHDRALGAYDRDRFMEYVKLPRNVFYMNADYAQRPENRDHPANIAADFRSVALLPPIRNDEPLVRDYLMHFFSDGTSYEPYVPYFLDTYLKEAFAETMILNGTGDMEKWYSLLNNPGKYQEIKDRIEIEFAPADKTFFRPEEPVAIDVDVKNVKQLIVKVFEINTMNYYRDQMNEIDTGVDLDGLVAGDEKTYTYDTPPMRRVRRHFEFPALNKRGVFVVELIGNGMSSRALVRKGQFTYLERASAAGHVFTALDESNRKLADASIWLAGHEYKAGDDGTITIPYSTSPGRQNILISCGGFTTLDRFDQKAEQYDLVAGIYVDRESLVKRAKARVLVRPALTVNGVPASLSLLEEPALAISSTDLEGVTTTKDVKGLKLTADEEFIHEFQVPENIVSLGFTLKGRVQSLSENRKLDLEASREFALNRIDTTDKVEDLHLSRVQSGYALDVLGKTGEKMPDRPVTLSLKHRDFTQPADAVVQSDGDGRIDLGTLKDIVSLTATGPEGVGHTWALPRQDSHSYPASVNGRVGDTLAVPYMGGAQEVDPASFSLLEKRSQTYVQDWLQRASIADGFLQIVGLPAGTYDLLMKETGTRMTINVTEGDAREGYALGANRLLEIRNPAPLQIQAVTSEDKNVVIRLKNSTPQTRAHVIANRFRPAYDVFRSLSGVLNEPVMITPSKLDSVYVSGRNIGDEYRYILERKYAQKFPGNMLTRPGLLLNPWALRQTETGAQEARAGEAPMALMARSEGGRTANGKHKAGGMEVDAFANLDFLPAPAAVLVNLKPDKDGVVSIPRKDLGNGQDVHVVAINPDNTACRELILPETALASKDLRLKDGLDPAKHFTEQKQVTVVGASSNLVINDITTSKIEGYDTVAKAYRLYSTLCPGDTLAEFAFITGWSGLKPEEQKEKYSKYACHELNFFLYKKDPKFFETAILPYLKNKKEKTFMDRWLIGDDLKDYLKPWAYGQLNVVERILLAQRIKEEVPAAARHLKDLQDLIPPDLERLNELFMTAIKGSALETGGAMAGFAEAQEIAAGYGGGDVDMSIAAPMEAAPAPAMAPKPESVTNALRRERLKRDGEKKALEKAMKEAAARGEAVDEIRMELREYEEAPATDVAYEMEDKARLDKDVARRGAVRRFYRKLDKTQEWAENNYYHLPIENQNADLVTVNPFWVDYANHAGNGPFFSSHMAEASRNFTEIMFALAVLDLPFEAKDPAAAYDGARMTMTPSSPVIAYHSEIRETTLDKNATPLLVSQNFFRASDRYRYENGEQFDKYVTDEFLTHVVYGCQVVLTDPTSAPLKLDVLLQIPRGAIPVNSGFFSRSRPVRLEPYSTVTFEYFFYFPAPGSFAHYPVHVARNGQLVASAPAVTMKAVDTPTKIDTTSWDYVSQNGKPEEVLAFLDTDNPNRLDLERIAWRMRDRDFFLKAVALLSRRHVYDQALWSYGILNDVPAAVREYLQHEDGFLSQCGAYLDCRLVTIDPVVRRSYQHLEYSPLVNARAHRLGKQRQILNDRFAVQYHSLLRVLSCKQAFDEADLMSLTYYMLLQDRVEEARRFFAQVDPKDPGMRLQYDYLQAYLDFYTPEHKLARAVAAKYADYPVDRWRNLFADVASQLDELEGKAAAVSDKESREQLQAKLAATEGGLDFMVESRKVTVNYQNLASAQVNYYLMDVELLFSRNPFVQQTAGQFAFIRPNRTDTLALPADKKTLTFDLPREFQNANVMVEITAGGVKKSQPYFANSLALQIVENYGQLKVCNQKTDAPMPGVYVKTYARMKNGEVRFYKDGYTDLRGKFDYTSLSTDELDNVEKFSILVLSESDGAVIKEANPPKR